MSSYEASPEEVRSVSSTRYLLKLTLIRLAGNNVAQDYTLVALRVMKPEH